ncbi:MAG: HAD family hydrolase, partial [Chloroflexaceae bacterium]|nr:HAD family hydrolase [Chloroflexaceae bacterium]
MHAIIFDMGNTLLRYAPPTWSWQQCEETSIDALYWELVGLGYCQRVDRHAFFTEMFRRMQLGWQAAVAGEANLRLTDWIAGGLKHFRVPPTVAPLEELAAIYAAPLRAQVTAMPGAAETLAELRSRGYRLGLISNTSWPGEFHRADLAAFGLIEQLEHLTFSGEQAVWKPNPAIFQRTDEALGATPGESVFIGDSPTEDVLGAQAAGLRAIWMHTHEFPLADVQPDGQIAHLAELPELVDVMRKT